MVRILLEVFIEEWIIPLYQWAKKKKGGDGVIDGE
jgi:hypothetical protein